MIVGALHRRESHSQHNLYKDWGGLVDPDGKRWKEWERTNTKE